MESIILLKLNNVFNTKDYFFSIPSVKLFANSKYIIRRERRSGNGNGSAEKHQQQIKI